MTDWQPDVMFADLSTVAGLRIMLQARYQHLVLKFLGPPVTESGLYEASWIGGKAESDTAEDLLRIICEELQDCGSARHDWITVSEIRDPTNKDNILRTQRLACIYCDTRERVITVSSPQDLPAPVWAAPGPVPARGQTCGATVNAKVWIPLVRRLVTTVSQQHAMYITVGKAGEPARGFTWRIWPHGTLFYLKSRATAAQGAACAGSKMILRQSRPSSWSCKGRPLARGAQRAGA